MKQRKGQFTRIDKRWIVPAEFRMDQVLDLTHPCVHSRLAPALAAALTHPTEANRHELKAFGERLKKSGVRGIVVPSWRGSNQLNLVILDSEPAVTPAEK